MKNHSFVLPVLLFPLFFTGCGATIGTISSVASIASSYIALRDYINETPPNETQPAPQAAQTVRTIQPPAAPAITTNPQQPSATYPMASNRYLYGPTKSVTHPVNDSLQSYYAYPVE